MNNKLIGIAGVAKCGKDSLFKAMRAINPLYERFSLGDKVKEDLFSVLKDVYNVDIFNCSPEEKERYREVIVTYANIKRDETNGSHWIDTLSPSVEKALKTNLIPVITDVRYANEVAWIKSLGGNVVHLKKYTMKNGEKIYLPPANAVEAANDPMVQDAADIKVEWEDNMPFDHMKLFAKTLLNTI